jgi:hypothetical protein
MDGTEEGADCASSGSVLCDRCQRQGARARVSREEAGQGGGGSGSGSGRRQTGSQAIAHAYSQHVQEQEAMLRFLDELKRHCIYC